MNKIRRSQTAATVNAKHQTMVKDRRYRVEKQKTPELPPAFGN
jgi:hypothetical protein